MFKLNSQLKTILIFLLAFFAIEIISFYGFLNPIFLKSVFIGGALLVLYLSIYKPKLALSVVLLELIIGSKGYLFYFPLANGQLIPGRIVIWSLFMLVFLGHFIKQLWQYGKEAPYLKNLLNFDFFKPYLFLALTIILGIISAFIYQNNFINIFLDFNNWLYFLLLIPLLSFRLSRREYRLIITFGALAVALKTFALLFIFSHQFYIAPTVYEWLRKTLVGEMTVLNGWNRVFIQAQNFVAIAYLFFFAKSRVMLKRDFYKKISSWLYLLVSGIFLGTIIISLSRSFWVGLAVALILSLFFIIKRKDLVALKRNILFIIISTIIAVVAIFAVIPSKAQEQFDEQISSRVNDKSEAAVSSRWSLLPPLFKEIIKNPITGQGFGATVTYISSDPRIVEQNESGLYTTYAFEWGYFDMWLKLGIIGVFAYLFLLFLLIFSAGKAALKNDDYFYEGMVLAFLFLAVTHFFTPYLNHPLGIGFIITSSCLIFKNKVY
ncbi:MAG: hypothetical protein PWQ35_51 [Patescibacteria group bacterium]|nr:hypothetical protein [Patescibacteria group bacterium]